MSDNQPPPSDPFGAPPPPAPPYPAPPSPSYPPPPPGATASTHPRRGTVRRPGYSQYPPGYGQYQVPSPYGRERPPLASWGKRVGGFLIDGLLVAAVAVATLILAAILGAVSDVLGVLVAVAGYALAFGGNLYLAYQAGATGQSIGMKQMGIRLLDERTGQPVGGWLGVGRYFVHFIDSLPCIPLGYLWPLWDDKNQTFTDKIFNHVVIEDQRR